MTFTFAPAVRDRVSLLIALAGASGSGKTLSALRIARGLAGGDDAKIAVIDTEAGRAKHYAVAPGERPSADRFGFAHGDLRPPFTPEAYADAIKAADEVGYDVIVIDSCSHEWEGEGGLHDIHDGMVDAAVAKARAGAEEKGWRFDEARERDKASVGAWREPKMRHKRFVSRLLQCRAHLILCMRAEEKIRIEKVKDDRGRERTVIVQPDDLRAIGKAGAERLFTTLVGGQDVVDQIRAARDELCDELVAHLHARGCGPDDVDAAWPIVWAEFDERWTYLTARFAAVGSEPH